jgi:hypothetical protein
LQRFGTPRYRFRGNQPFNLRRNAMKISTLTRLGLTVALSAALAAMSFTRHA